MLTENRLTLENSYWLHAVPFILCHLAVLGAFWTGVKWVDVYCCLCLYLIRMFAVTAGYHRYFSHKSFKTSRVFAFILGFIAESSLQKGVLWWAAHHRQHHRHVDRQDDPHSPKILGLVEAHIGWLHKKQNLTYDRAMVADLERLPELRWLQKYHLVPPLSLALATWLWLGWSGLWIGFFFSTVLLWHGTFCVNSICHYSGYRRFDTNDCSKNNLFVTILTLGEGWHNNHHKFPFSAKSGVVFWEIDITYYVLRLLRFTGLVWGFKYPPGLK